MHQEREAFEKEKLLFLEAFQKAKEDKRTLKMSSEIDAEIYVEAKAFDSTQSYAVASFTEEPEQFQMALVNEVTEEVNTEESGNKEDGGGDGEN